MLQNFSWSVIKQVLDYEHAKTLTYDEWWSAVTWYFGFGIGREDDVDDPET